MIADGATSDREERLTRVNVTLPSLLATAIAALTLAVPAHAAWTPPDLVSQTERSIDNLRLAAGSDGRLLASWQFFERRRSGGAVASRSPEGRWEPQRTVGQTTVQAGGRVRATGAGEGLSSIAGFGRNGVVALATNGAAPRTTLQWWRGTTSGALRRGGTLPESPWYPGAIAAFPDGAAVAAWTTMRPRAGAGSNLRPRVAVISTRSGAATRFSAPRRISPLPPAPPYGGGRGPRLSATALEIAVGGARMVLAAWQREGRVEARVSRDRGRSWGPLRRLGRSERHPRIGVAISAGGHAVVTWTTRAAAGAERSLVTRVARSNGHGRFRARLLERTPAPATIPAAVADQYGPRAMAGFAGDTPVVAWQGAEAGHIVVRSAFLRSVGDERVTHRAPAGQTAVLADLVALPAIGSAALAVQTVGATDRPLHGYVQRAIPGGGFGSAALLPLEAVRSLRLAAVRDGWVIAAVTRGADGDRVQSTVDRG